MKKVLFVETVYDKPKLQAYKDLAGFLLELGIEAEFLTQDEAVNNFFGAYSNFKSHFINSCIDEVQVETQEELIDICAKFESKFASTFSEPKYELPSIRSVYYPELCYLDCKEDEFKHSKKVLNYLNSLDEFFEENKYDVIFQYQGAEVLRRTAAIVAREKGIRNLFIGFSPIKGTSSIYNNEFALWDNIDISGITSEERETTIAFIKEYTTKKTNHFHKKFSIFDFWINRIKNLDFSCSSNEYSSLYNRLRIYFKKKINKYINKMFSFMIYEKFDENSNYMFLPMHFPPESQVTIRSNKLFDQTYLVKLLSNSLPQGVDLVVKEHPNVLGSQVLSELKTISDLPNVKLVPPNTDTHKIIQNSQGVITINSTAGFEALLYKKSVVTVGKVFYKGDVCTYDIEKLNETPYKIKEALQNTINEEELYKLINGIIKASYDGDFNTPEKLAKSLSKVI